MPSVSVPMKSHQDFQSERNDFELVNLGHQVEDLDSLAVRLVELMLRRHDGANRLFQALVFRGLVGEPDGIEVVRALDFAHGAEGNIDRRD